MDLRFTNSEIFNSAKTNQIVSSLQRINPDKFYSEKEINKNLENIRWRMHSPVKAAVMRNIENGMIKFFQDEKVILPIWLNYLPVDVSGRKMILVNTAYYNQNKSGDTLELYPMTFAALAQNALVSKTCGEKFNSLLNRSQFYRTTARVYATLATKIFDKMFAITLNPKMNTFINFLFAKFALVNQMQMNDREEINDIAYNIVPVHGLSITDTLQIEQGMLDNDHALYTSILHLLDGISKIPDFNKLRPNLYIDQYVRMYGETSLLALDYFPAFLQMIYSADQNAGLNNEFIIQKTAAKDIQNSFKAYTDVASRV